MGLSNLPAGQRFGLKIMGDHSIVRKKHKFTNEQYALSYHPFMISFSFVT